MCTDIISGLVGMYLQSTCIVCVYTRLGIYGHIVTTVHTSIKLPIIYSLLPFTVAVLGCSQLRGQDFGLFLTFLPSPSGYHFTLRNLRLLSCMDISRYTAPFLVHVVIEHPYMKWYLKVSLSLDLEYCMQYIADSHEKNVTRVHLCP